MAKIERSGNLTESKLGFTVTKAREPLVRVSIINMRCCKANTNTVQCFFRERGRLGKDSRGRYCRI